MAEDYTKTKAWWLAEELALLAYPKEFQESEVGLFSYMRKVWRLTSEVQCLNCSYLRSDAISGNTAIQYLPTDEPPFHVYPI